MLMEFWWQRVSAYIKKERSSSLSSLSSLSSSSLKENLTIKIAVLLFFFIVISVFYYFSADRVAFAKHYETSSEITPKIFDNKQAPPVEFPLNCTKWNLHNNTCPKNYPATFNPDPSLNSVCPDYFKWIHEDLRHWKHNGITREMLDKVREYNAHFRLVILDGKIYVEKYKDSIQTRALFTIWGIVQLLRFYPGRLPDLELMFDCDDRPVVRADDNSRPDSDPPPLFRYCSDEEHLDIVFPDWSFWGWAEVNIRPWRKELKSIKKGNKKIKWKDRVPYAYWKGNPYVAPWRGDLMKCNVTHDVDWNTRLYIQDWTAQEKSGFKDSDLGDQCTHRYKIYIEGWAWSVSEKYIFACDSPVLLLTPRFYDFFIRGMMPQQHYWPVRDNGKCRSLKYAVEYGNNHTEKAESIGIAGSRFVHKDMKMERVFDYMFHLLSEYALLLKFKPVVPPNAVEVWPESLACATEGNRRRFMEESLEKSPSLANPCTLPPPYDPATLRAFKDEKIKLIQEVEAQETKYYKN